MRKHWTDWVGETRRKGNRGKKYMSYREAMKQAITWPKQRKKLERKFKREARKKSVEDKPIQKVDETSTESVSTEV